MEISRHLGSILKAAGIGFLGGMSLIAAEDKGAAHVLFILSMPVAWVGWLAQKIFGLSDGATGFLGWLGLGIYWMILGGLIGWGISVARSRAMGDE